MVTGNYQTEEDRLSEDTNGLCQMIRLSTWTFRVEPTGFSSDETKRKGGFRGGDRGMV